MLLLSNTGSLDSYKSWLYRAVLVFVFSLALGTVLTISSGFFFVGFLFAYFWKTCQRATRDVGEKREELGRCFAWSHKPYFSQETRLWTVNCIFIQLADTDFSGLWENRKDKPVFELKGDNPICKLIIAPKNYVGDMSPTSCWFSSGL